LDIDLKPKFSRQMLTSDESPLPFFDDPTRDTAGPTEIRPRYKPQPLITQSSVESRLASQESQEVN